MITVRLEPSWKHNLSAYDLLPNPPEGYQFVLDSGVDRSFFGRASKSNWAYTVQHFIGTRIPLVLAKSYLERLRQPRAGADLTYSTLHLVLRRESWILDMQCEPPHLLVWIRWAERQKCRYRDRVKEALTAADCRKIICWVEAGKRAFSSWLGSELEDKIEVVHWSASQKSFVKNYDKEKVTMLFVNSGNINTASHFNRKGGSEVLAAFRQLDRQYSSLELVVRSALPGSIKREYSRMPNIRFIDRPVAWKELEREWLSADIFVLPTRVTPAKVFLDAMSYELPIVTTDVWGNPELVTDRKTGLLVPYPRANQYIRDWIPYYHSEYEGTFRTTDYGLVRGLVERISSLIESPALRQRLGRAGRYEVEKGRFSVRERNRKLKRLLDDAMAS